MSVLETVWWCFLERRYFTYERRLRWLRKNHVQWCMVDYHQVRKGGKEGGRGRDGGREDVVMIFFLTSFLSDQSATG